jgi:hypothetical protein
MGSRWIDRRAAFWEALALARLGRWSEADRRRSRLAEDASDTPGPTRQRVLRCLDGVLSLLRGDSRGAVAALSEAATLLPARGFCGEHVPIWCGLARAHMASGIVGGGSGLVRAAGGVRPELRLARATPCGGGPPRRRGLRANERILHLWGNAAIAPREQDKARRFLLAREQSGPESALTEP